MKKKERFITKLEFVELDSYGTCKEAIVLPDYLSKEYLLNEEVRVTIERINVKN